MPDKFLKPYQPRTLSEAVTMLEKEKQQSDRLLQSLRLLVTALAETENFRELKPAIRSGLRDDYVRVAFEMYREIDRYKAAPLPMGEQIFFIPDRDPVQTMRESLDIADDDKSAVFFIIPPGSGNYG